MKLDIQQSNLLWNDFIKGSETAYSQLYKLYAEPMYRYGLLVSREEHKIEDAIHDVFVKLHSNRSKLPEVANPKGYLFISLRNRLLNTSIGKKEISFDLEMLDVLYDKTEHKTVEDSLIDDEEEIYKNNLLARLKNLLTDKEREAIYYRFNELLSYNDIAQLMGIQLQSAKNLVQKSLNKMRSNINIPIYLIISILSETFTY